MVSKPQNHPTRGVDSRTSGHVVQPEGSPARTRWGPTVGPPGSPGRKKFFFPKFFLDHFVCSNNCFWAILSRFKSGGALPKLRILCPKTAFFGPKRPQNPIKTAKRSKTVATLHVRLDFTVSKSPLVPFNSTICPRNGPKRRKKTSKSAQCAPTPRNQARAVSWATWLKSEFRGHLVHPQSPTFCGHHPSESPNETPRPSYQWSLGGAGRQPGPRMVGAKGGSTRVPGAEKIIFSKVVPRPLGMPKQVF